MYRYLCTRVLLLAWPVSLGSGFEEQGLLKWVLHF